MNYFPISQTHYTRREWLRLAGTGLVTTLASNSLADIRQDPKTYALEMLDEKIEQLKNNGKEKETVRLLKLFRENLATKGEMGDKETIRWLKIWEGNSVDKGEFIDYLGSFIPTIYDYHEEGSKLVLDKMYPLLQPEFVNSHWNNRNISCLQDSFISECLKQAVYFSEYKENPDKVLNNIRICNALVRRVKKAPDLRGWWQERELASMLSEDSKLVEIAKHYIAHFLNWEYIGYEAQLEYLHRRGFGSEAQDFARQNSASYEDRHLWRSFGSNLERMKFISHEGNIDKKGFKKVILQDMIAASDRISNGRHELVRDPLRCAFFILWATHPYYKHQTKLTDAFETSKLFDFVWDEKYRVD